MKSPENTPTMERINLEKFHNQLFQDYLKWLNDNDGLQAKDYDSFEEFHFDGDNKDLAEMKEGNYPIESVKLFIDPNTEDIKLIKVLFLSNGAGHNIDFFLYNRAIDDYFEYLKQYKTQEIENLKNQIKSENSGQSEEQINKLIQKYLGFIPA